MSQEVLTFLKNRTSAPRLEAPAPAGEQLQEIFQAAFRVPDHARLRPWRFLCVSGDRRRDFGELLLDSLLQREPLADASQREKARSAPLRAPLVVIAIASPVEHPKVPVCEQRWSTACATHALLLAAESQGFAGVWRTGEAAFDRHLMNGLGLATTESIVGFLYLGTRQGTARPAPVVSYEDKVTQW